jgi:hypothetical protein
MMNRLNVVFCASLFLLVGGCSSDKDKNNNPEGGDAAVSDFGTADGTINGKDDGASNLTPDGNSPSPKADGQGGGTDAQANGADGKPAPKGDGGGVVPEPKGAGKVCSAQADCAQGQYCVKWGKNTKGTCSTLCDKTCTDDKSSGMKTMCLTSYSDVNMSKVEYQACVYFCKLNFNDNESFKCPPGHKPLADCYKSEKSIELTEKIDGNSTTKKITPTYCVPL